MELVEKAIEFSTNFISSGGVLFGFFIVYLECLIPVLPLSVFIALNVNAFGFFIGVLISWISTCLGCVTCYYLYVFLGDKLTKKFVSYSLSISSSICSLYSELVKICFNLSLDTT